ncbi:EI24 domain-containing protein [Desulfospira joergensenii]|uniref:EI24 domain-containing protein n=1 Tax=Desulfospira joergensenii TaxID=53329 RepID=UPI0003B47699|nr:EI24 domain-containing protein [Desulfospira joergensenii]
MEFFSGIKYNLKGLGLAMKTPSLLMLGLLRFLVILLLTLSLVGLILLWHDQILSMIWKAPESGWLVYIWKIASWILTLFLAGIAMVLSYLIAQLFFGVFIMDYMSRITERMVLGQEKNPVQTSLIQFFLHLVRQEIPRAVIPVIISLLIMIFGLFTPLSPAIILISALTAAMFMAWDNTDLVPARRMVPFRTRVQYLRQNLMFHLGFGLLFLVPWLNILILSFAPVGATLYVLDKESR